jgi:predicted acylesterase/phospholipase RssA
MMSDSSKSLEAVDTLVFEGGGIKGIVYVGALAAVEGYYQNKYQKSFLSQVTTIAGTSAGSIVALLLALNLNIAQLDIILQNTSFSSFKDEPHLAKGKGPLGMAIAILHHGYLCEGKTFMEWTERILLDYAGSKDITFAELQREKGKDLHVYAVRLNDGEVIDFNAKETPNVRVALAVRMSMSIPIYFKPVCVKEIITEDGKRYVKEAKEAKEAKSYHETTTVGGAGVTGEESKTSTEEEKEEIGTIYYVDGGVLANYPFKQIQSSTSSFSFSSSSSSSDHPAAPYRLDDSKILGFRVDSEKEIRKTAFQSLSSPSPAQYNAYLADFAITTGIGFHMIGDVISCFQAPQETEFNKSQVIQNRTIRCLDCNISTFDFDLKNESIYQLITSGKEAASAFLGVEMPFSPRTTMIAPTRKEEREKLLMFAQKYAAKETRRLSSLLTEMLVYFQQTGDGDDRLIAFLNDINRLKTNIETLKQHHLSLSFPSSSSSSSSAAVSHADVDMSSSSSEPAVHVLESLLEHSDNNQESTSSVTPERSLRRRSTRKRSSSPSLIFGGAVDDDMDVATKNNKRRKTSKADEVKTSFAKKSPEELTLVEVLNELDEMEHSIIVSRNKTKNEKEKETEQMKN